MVIITTGKAIRNWKRFYRSRANGFPPNLARAYIKVSYRKRQSVIEKYIIIYNKKQQSPIGWGARRRRIFFGVWAVKHSDLLREMCFLKSISQKISACGGLHTSQNYYTILKGNTVYIKHAVAPTKTITHAQLTHPAPISRRNSVMMDLAWYR